MENTGNLLLKLIRLPHWIINTFQRDLFIFSVYKHQINEVLAKTSFLDFLWFWKPHVLTKLKHKEGLICKTTKDASKQNETCFPGILPIINAQEMLNQFCFFSGPYKLIALFLTPEVSQIQRADKDELPARSILGWAEETRQGDSGQASQTLNPRV